MRSRTQTPRDFSFPSIPPLVSLPSQVVKTQVWCKTASPGANNITIQTTSGDTLVLCNFEFNANTQQVFTPLQISDLHQV